MLSTYLTKKLEEAGEDMTTCMIVAAALYNHHVENFGGWSSYSVLSKRRKEMQKFSMHEFWLQFNQNRQALVRLMRCSYKGIPANTLSPYMDGEKEPNIYSPLHLVV
jgi:hypothetical protein